jgi:anti-sigma B factor antagonist
MDLDTQVERVDAGVVRVALTGEADLGTVDQLREAIAAAREIPGVRSIVVDASELAYLASSALGALIAGYRVAQQGGLSYRVVNPSFAARSVMAVTGTLEMLTGQRVGEPEYAAD